jgi:hypothetical protein
MKRKFIVISIVAGAVLGIVGGGFALNGYFGGGGAIPTDTFSRNLVGYWAFEDGGGVTATDASGLSNDLTLTTMDPNTDWVAGKGGNGGALDFDGSDDHLTRADDADFDFAAADDFTITGWFKHAAIATNPDYLFVKNDTDGGYKVYMDADGDIAFGIDDDTAWTPDDVVGDDQSLNFDDGAWHHFAAVKDGATAIYIYVDGILRDSDTSLTATGSLENADPLYIGVDEDGTSNEWAGTLDEIRVYSRLLSAVEIKFHFNRGGPAVHLRFDEGAGGTAFDASGNLNDGVITNATWDTGGACQFGLCMRFDGSGDEVDISDF